MTLSDLLGDLTRAAAAGDGAGVAACFTEDGAYHDVFYGTFRGRAAITDMIENHFHRDGEDFRWDIFEPVDDGASGYARYVFSYRSKLPAFAGRRAVFEGVAVVKLRDGLIAEYGEVANAATGLSMLGFPEARLAKFAAKQAKELCERDEAARHRE